MPFLITSSLIPSRRSHLARVIFKKLFSLLIPSGKWRNWGCFSKIFSLTYSQWGKPLIKVFLKNPSKILLLRGNPFIAPSLTPWLKSILWTPSLIPSGKGRFLSSFQKIFRVLNPHWETVLSTYPARISPTIPYSNFCGRKTTRFLKKYSYDPIPQLLNPKNDIVFGTFFNKLMGLYPSLLYRKFFRANLNTYFKKLSLILLLGHLKSKTAHPSRKKHKNSACLVFRSKRYIFSGIQL